MKGGAGVAAVVAKIKREFESMRKGVKQPRTLQQKAQPLLKAEAARAAEHLTLHVNQTVSLASPRTCVIEVPKESAEELLRKE
jgi:hypothetical protein